MAGTILFSDQNFSHIDGSVRTVIAKDTKTGAEVHFNNAEAIFKLVDKPNDFKGFIDFVGKITSVLSVASDLSDAAVGLKKILGTTSTVFSVTSAIIDGSQMCQDTNPDTISDFVISCIGVFGTPGAIANISLAYGKKGIVGATKLYLFGERYIINSISQQLVGIDIK